MGKMKGSSPLIGHGLSVLLAVVVISGVSILMFNFFNTLQQDQIKRDLTQVAAQVSSEITDLHSIAQSSKVSPSTSSAVLVADSSLKLPEKVAGKSYRVTLVSAGQISVFIDNVTLDGGETESENMPENGKILVSTTEEPRIEVVYDVPSIDADMQGTSGNPSNVTMRYYRYNPNGTILDAILLGDQALIAQVTSVS